MVLVMSDENQESNGALNYTMIMLYKQMQIIHSWFYSDFFFLPFSFFAFK